jgi:ATPase family AAA domain-containing protein 1
MSMELSRAEFLGIFFRVTIASVVTFYSLKWMMNQIDPTNKNKKKAKAKAEQLMNR